MFARPSIFKNDLSAFLRRSVTKTRYLYEVSRHVGLYLFVFLFISRNDKSVGRFPSVGWYQNSETPSEFFDCFHFTFIISCWMGACFLTAIAYESHTVHASRPPLYNKNRIHPGWSHTQRKVANGWILGQDVPRFPLPRNGVPATLSTANKLSRLRYCTDDRLVRLLTAMRGIIAYARILLLPIDVSTVVSVSIWIRRSPTLLAFQHRLCISKKHLAQLAFRVPAKTHVKNRQKLLCTVFVSNPTIAGNRIIFDILNMSESFISLYTKGKSPKADTVMPVRLSPVPLWCIRQKACSMPICSTKTTRHRYPAKGRHLWSVKVTRFLYQSFSGCPGIDSSVFQWVCIVFFLHHPGDPFVYRIIRNSPINYYWSPGVLSIFRLFHVHRLGNREFTDAQSTPSSIVIPTRNRAETAILCD